VAIVCPLANLDRFIWILKGCQSSICQKYMWFSRS
jgi:hypothetical protein